MRIAGLVSIIIIVAAVISLAGVEEYYGQTILSVDLANNTVAADSFLVYNSSGLIPGDILTAGKVQDAVKRIYGLGLFSDVKVLAEPATRGVRIHLQIESYPRISKIRFRGNKNIKTKKLKKTVTLTEGRIVSPGVVISNKGLIKDLYEDKGYLNAQIETETAPDIEDSSRVVLTFRVKEGSKVKIRRIAFIGNRAFPDKKLRSKISTKQKSLFRGGNFDRIKFNEDRQKIVDFYKEKGYIDAVVLADTVCYGNQDKMRFGEFTAIPGDDAKDMYIKIWVEEGERYYFGNFTWEGNEIFKDDKINSVFNIKEGDVYNQKKYDEMLFKLYEMYQDEGYWYAQVDEQKTPRDQKLDVHFSIVEGNPVYVRMIHIEGNTKTQDKVIRRELKVRPNTIFKRSILGRSLREVMVLNFFGNVTPDWNILDNGDIDLIINVEEKPTGQFQVGAGYSASDKLVGTIGLGIPNFRGGGQTVSFNSDFGKRRTTFSLSYYEPWLLDTPTSLGLSVYFQERDWYDYYDESRRGGSIRVGRRLNWPDNYFKIYTSYSLESIRYYNFSDDFIEGSYYRFIVRNNDGDSVGVDSVLTGIVTYDWPLMSSIWSVTLERDSRDLSQFATSGSDIWWTGELGGTFLGGNWDYYKQTLNSEFYYTPFWRFTFSLKTKWGYSFGIHNANEVPFAAKFTPGGTDPDGIIRGYDDSDVGPQNVNGAPIGGRSLAVYNAELTIPLADQQFYVLLFADAGNAWLSASDLSKNFYNYKKLMKSYGFGFRVVAPMIGIIGFDFGMPLNGPDKGLKPHFQIGRGF